MNYNQVIIGIFCTMLLIVGFVTAEEFTFADSYDSTYYTGQISLDENGIINGAAVAGVTNGAMNVDQTTSQDGSTIFAGQTGTMEGSYGFAATG
ncbi:hypothetical protein EHM76_03965, partial [bacterium]